MAAYPGAMSRLARWSYNSVIGDLVVPADAEVERELLGDAPIVGHVDVVGRGAEIEVAVAVAQGGGVGAAQQETGEIETGSRRGYAVQEFGGAGAGEGVLAARVGVAGAVQLLAAVVRAEGHIVHAVDPDQAVADAAGLVANQGRRAVAEAGVVGE